MFGKIRNESEPKAALKDNSASLAVACIGCKNGNCYLCLRKLFNSNRVESLGDSEPRVIHVEAAVGGKRLG